MQNVNKTELEYLVIPRYLYQDNRLNVVALKLYCFINTFTGYNFFFSNEHLADMFRVNIKTISRAIKELTKYGYIKVAYKIKADGGKIRFVENTLKLASDETDVSRPKGHSSLDKDINIKDNVNVNGLVTDVTKTPHSFKLEDFTLQVITYYFKQYKDLIGSKHPFIPNKRLEEIQTSIIGNDWDMDIDQWKTVIDKWFRTNIDSDRSIYHFLSGDIINNRFYEEIY